MTIINSVISVAIRVEHDAHRLPCSARHVHTDCHPAEETLVPVVDPGFDGNRCDYYILFTVIVTS